jgi:hypothetical protein
MNANNEQVMFNVVLLMSLLILLLSMMGLSPIGSN